MRRCGGPAISVNCCKCRRSRRFPVIVTTEDQRAAKADRPLFLGGRLVGVILVVAAIHLFVRPLDVLWVMLARRFGA